MEQQKDIRLNFTNYNYAFNNFYDNYKETCLKLSDKINVTDLQDIRKLISTFIYEYDYTIDDINKKESYRQQLKVIQQEMIDDEELSKISNKDFSIISNRIEYQNLYYFYFLKYLAVFGKYIAELTDSFMPNTNIQKKQLRFSNSQLFFEKFSQHKRIVVESLADFKLYSFSVCFNKMITFYYAYNLYINNNDKILIDRLFSLIISYYLDKKNLGLMMVSSPSASQLNGLSYNSQVLNEGLLYVNSVMNSSFSSFDVLPKIQKKIYEDRTLI